MPKAMLTGRAGGTVMTIKSKNLTNISIGSTTSCNFGIIPKYVMMAKKKRNSRNLPDYLWKMFSCYFGNKIILMSCPFIVTKLVLVTQTGMPKAYLIDSKTAIFFLQFTWIIVVPSNTKALLSTFSVLLLYF